VLENVAVKDTIISIYFGFQRNTVSSSGYVHVFLFSTSATNILGNCITFYHQQSRYDGHGNSTSAIPYCIVFLLLPFLLEHRASVKHFRFTSVPSSGTVSRTPWISDQPTARPLPNTNTE
jgi:hypothetical protein